MAHVRVAVAAAAFLLGACAAVEPAGEAVRPRGSAGRPAASRAPVSSVHLAVVDLPCAGAGAGPVDRARRLLDLAPGDGSALAAVELGGVLYVHEPERLELELELEDVSARSVLHLAAAYSGRTVVVAPGAGRQRIDVAFSGASFAEVVTGVAERVGLTVRWEDGVVLATDGPSAWGSEDPAELDRPRPDSRLLDPAPGAVTVDLDVADATLEDAVGALEAQGVAVTLRGDRRDPDPRVTVAVRGVPAWAALNALALLSDRDAVRGADGAVALRVPPRITFQGGGARLRTVAQVVGRYFGANTVFGPGVPDPGPDADLPLLDARWPACLEAVVAAQGLRLARPTPSLFVVHAGALGLADDAPAAAGGSRSAEAAVGERLTLVRAPLAAALRLLAGLAGLAIVVDPAVEGLVSHDLVEGPWDAALLRVVARLEGCAVTERADGAWVVGPALGTPAVERLAVAPDPLAVQGTFVAPTGARSRAIVGGRVVAPGDPIVDPETGAPIPGLRVAEVEPHGVTFARGEEVLRRGLREERPSWRLGE